jgi:UDP-glucose 4-epimerase
LPVELVVGDIRDRQVVDRVMAGVQVVIALAAHTGVVQSVENPAEDMSINVEGTLNLLEAARRHRVDRFIFASTGGAIVGEADPPVHEEMPPRPLSPYGAGKLAGEGYCSAFWGSYGLKTVPLRFSNIYGPFSYHKGSVIAKFFRQIQTRQELTIYGDGEQTRDFLFVEDLCQAIIAAMTAELPLGQPIQLGTGQETTVNALVHLMRRVVGEPQFPPGQSCAGAAGGGAAQRDEYLQGREIPPLCPGHGFADGSSENLEMVSGAWSGRRARHLRLG